MRDELVLTFDGDQFSAIYADALRPYFEDLGPVETRRASDVEPEGDGWVAEIRDWVPGGAVRLPVCPTRAEALALEIAYLKEVLL